MDMSKYAGDSYLTLDDLRASGPLQATIESIDDGNFDKPVAKLSDGSAVQLNISNTRALIRNWGKNSADWLGREIEVSIGKVPFRGDLVDGIVVRPVSAALPESARTPAPEPPPIDDDIPF